MTQGELDELVALLVRLILDGLITEDDANQIIDFVRENGHLPPNVQLPLPISEAIPADLPTLVSGYLAQPPIPQYDIDQAQDKFEARVARFTRKFLFNGFDLKTWQENFKDALIEYLARAALNGAMVNMTGSDRENAVIEMVRVQLAFLARFADTAAVDQVSVAQMENRSKMYSGEGRGEYYRQEGQTNAQVGWVADYTAVDDQATCEPCRQAEDGGPYLPDDLTAPFPGTVCLGRGYCRCTRAYRYDPPTYFRLTAQLESQPA